MKIGIAPARNAKVQRRLVAMMFSKDENKNRQDVSGDSMFIRAIQPNAVVFNVRINRKSGDLDALVFFDKNVSKTSIST